MPVAEINGLQMYYEEHGDPAAEPLLLIAGFGNNAAAWAPQVAGFSPRYRVVAFDNRGAGRTSQPDGAYSIPQMADDAAALLDRLGIEAAHVFGVSMGGMIAQELALRHPARLRTLVLGCTTPGGAHSAGHPGLMAKTEEGLATKELSELMTPERLQQYALELFTPQFLADPGPDFPQFIASVVQHPQTVPGLHGQVHAIRAHDTYDRLPQIAAPTLVITGGEDPLIDAANSRILAERIPDAELHVIEGVRHGFPVERAEETNRLVLDFLAHRGAAVA
jgi:3-oxoadipate enol-lactonase